MENLLARFGPVDAVFTPNESTTFGCLRALQDHGLAGKIVHVGFDSSAKLVEALEKGELQGLVLQDPVAMGYQSVRTVVAHLRGEPYEKTVATAVVLADRDNMNEPAIRRLLRPDLSILGRQEASMITSRRVLPFIVALALLGPGAESEDTVSVQNKAQAAGAAAPGRLHIISSSHQDIAWMDSPEKCIIFRDTNCITPALAMMAKDPAYSFTMENMLNLAEYLERHPDRNEEIGRLTREGRMEWGATYNQPYESLLSGEQLIRQAYFGRLWLKRTFPGADAKVYFNPDVPGRAAQMPQILAKAGIPYLLMSRYHEGFYRWASPDGSSVLAYSPGHYGNAAAYLNAPPAEGAKTIADKVAKWTGYYAGRGLPDEYPLLNSVDFSQPTDFGPLIRHWNGDGAAPGGGRPVMQYSSARKFFEAIDVKIGQARDRHRRAAGPVALHPRADPPLGHHGGARGRPAPARGRGLQHGPVPARGELRELSRRSVSTPPGRPRSTPTTAGAARKARSPTGSSARNTSSPGTRAGPCSTTPWPRSRPGSRSIPRKASPSSSSIPCRGRRPAP